MHQIRTFALLFVVALLGPAGAAPAPPALPAVLVTEVPHGFNYVGTYKLVKRVKVRSGKPFLIVIPALSYRVYSDGITLRFYGGSDEDGHTSFDIYRSDGITRLRSGNLLENEPGVQARSTVGQVLRQVTLTGRTMTLTKFPALSDAVEITYAARVADGAHLEASHPPKNP